MFSNVAGLIVTLVIGQHIQMERGDVLHVQVRLLLGIPEVDDLDVPFALVADVDAVPVVLFDREIGEGLLFLVAAEGAFDPPIIPLEAALVAEEVTGSLIVPDLADLGFPAADGAVALRPFRLPDDVAVYTPRPSPGPVSGSLR